MGINYDGNAIRFQNPVNFLERFFKNKMAVAGSIVVMLLFAVSLLAPWIAPYAYDAQMRDVRLKSEGMTVFYWPLMRSNLERPDVPLPDSDVPLIGVLFRDTSVKALTMGGVKLQWD